MKFQFPKLNIKKVFQYIFLVLISSIILILIGYAFPVTEQYLKFPSNNVIINDSAMWSKKYRVDIEIDESNKDKKWSLINQTKNTLYSRLSKYGVEFTRIEYRDLEERKGELLITVQTTKDEDKVLSLINQKGDMKVVIKKEEANFTDEKQPYAAYMPENYDDTNLSRKDFRTIYVTKLSTTAGDEAYFGILKPWIWNGTKYDKFIVDNAAKEGGINNDGFVTPVTIPIYTVDAYSAKPIFAFSLGTDASAAYIQEIVYNSGYIPVNYTYKDVVDIETSFTYNYYLVFGILAGCLAIGLIISSYITNTNLLVTASALFASTVLLIDFLKITQSPILSITLILGISFAMTYTIALLSFKDKWKVILVVGLSTLLMSIPTRSIFNTFAPVFLYFVTSIPILVYLNEKYINTFKNTLRR